jgi:hypothetical protein
MGTRRALPIAAVLLLLASCFGSSAPHRDQPTPRLAHQRSHQASPSTIALTTLSGRIVFDNHDDIWSINADGTALTQLTSSPCPSSTPHGPRTELGSRTVPNPMTIHSSGS